MSTQMVVADSAIDYSAKEVGPIVLALAFVIALGGMAAATILVCGWRGARSVAASWFHGKITIVCR